jgi:DNA-binding SARP family transcriptional activator
MTCGTPRSAARRQLAPRPPGWGAILGRAVILAWVVAGALLAQPGRAGAAETTVSADSVQALADPGTSLAVPADGRLRGYQFAGQVLGVATGPRLGTGSAAYRAGPGQRLWVFGLSWTGTTDGFGVPQTVTPTLVVDGSRLPIPLPPNLGQGASPNATFPTGPMYWLASVPASAADVAVELASAGYAQTFSLTAMARQGPQPAVLYRDPTSWQIDQPLSDQDNLPTPDPTGDTPNAALPVTLSGVSLSWFGPDNPSDIPANPNLAWLVPNLSSNPNSGMCYPSLPPADVTLTLPGAKPQPATAFPGLGPDQNGIGAFTALYAFQVPASLTTATLTIAPGTLQAQTLDCTQPVTVTAGTASFPLSFPATPYTPPSGAASTPAAIRNLPASASSSAPGPSSSFPTGLVIVIAVLVALGGSATLITARRHHPRRSGGPPGAASDAPPAAQPGWSPSTAAWTPPPQRDAAPTAAAANGQPNSSDTRPAPVEQASPQPAVGVSPSGPPTPPPPAPFQPPQPPPLEGLVVRVLGPIQVSGWVEPPARALVTNLAVYLASHPDRPVTATQLQTVLGHGLPTEPDRSTIRTNLSRLRRAAGPHRLPEAAPAGYRLQGVTLDWAVLQQATAQARHETHAHTAMELLGPALALVTGPPYGTDSGYGWVDHEDHRSPIEIAVAAAANHLADLALGHQQADLALWAAHQGLLANPLDDSLALTALTAAHATRRPGALSHEWTVTTRRLASRDLQPSPQLTRHYQHLAAEPPTRPADTPIPARVPPPAPP